MLDGIRWVGLDVHARESTFAVFDQATGEVATKRVMGRPHELLPWLRAVVRPARMVYEAGPTGYGLARRALAEGIELSVCAPSKTERPSDRIKTDQRDAVRLAKLLAARRSSVSSCAIWSAAGRTSARTWSAPAIGSGTSCCAVRSTGRAPVKRGRASTARG
jgi:transposase